LNLEVQEQIEPIKPYRILKTATYTKSKLKIAKTFKNMMNNTEIRTQKLKE